jgi:hypothetical protein
MRRRTHVQLLALRAARDDHAIPSSQCYLTSAAVRRWQRALGSSRPAWSSLAGSYSCPARSGSVSNARRGVLAVPVTALLALAGGGYGVEVIELGGTIAAGRFLSGASASYPTVVLGSATARQLGVDRADGTTQLWLGRHWFTVVGILEPVPLAPELDRAALIGFPVAHDLLGADGSPATIYLRADPDVVPAVAAVLARSKRRSAPSPAHCARREAPAAATLPCDRLTGRGQRSGEASG